MHFPIEPMQSFSPDVCKLMETCLFNMLIEPSKTASPTVTSHYKEKSFIQILKLVISQLDRFFKDTQTSFNGLVVDRIYSKKIVALSVRVFRKVGSLECYWHLITRLMSFCHFSKLLLISSAVTTKNTEITYLFTTNLELKRFVHWNVSRPRWDANELNIFHENEFKFKRIGQTLLAKITGIKYRNWKVTASILLDWACD